MSKILDDKPLDGIEDEAELYFAKQRIRHLSDSIVADKPHRGKCGDCGKYSRSIQRRRLNAAYANDELNWLTSCPACYKARQEQLADDWAEYYSNCC